MQTRRGQFEKLNEPEFIASLRAGDENAYRELDKELFPFFRNFVHKEYGFNKEDARDIVQEVALRIFERVKTFDTAKGRFVTWAFQILRNLCFDQLRYKKKLKLISIENLLQEHLISAPEYVELKRQLTPLERLPQELVQALLKLPDHYQQYLGLFLLGVQDHDIMKIMKINTHEALRSLKSRVLSKLKIEIEKAK